MIEQLTEPQYTEDNLFPVLVYEYDKDGRYGPLLRIENEADMKLWFMTKLKPIIDGKREVRITDTGDLMCFHARNGKILYDGKNHYPEGPQ